jgi:hypothetical protein
MSEHAANAQLVSGQPYKDYELALVMKLTFRITENGQCVPAEQQLPLIDDFPVYEELEAPHVSPPCWDSDLMAFKAGTDVVVQGHAYSYSEHATTVDTELKLPGVSRVVRVHGSRRVEWQGKKPVFTPAEPFEQMPLRYDRAYGGCDVINQPKVSDILLHQVKEASPGWRLDTFSDHHYPRNPAGRGFLMKLTREASADLELPNLEFPFDPITPERLAIGEPMSWMNAPLPAAYDWIDPSWFPRIAYLGLTPEYYLPEEGVKEIGLGWAAPDLMKLRTVRHGGFHPTFQHAASPGLVRRRLQPATQMELRNLFPKQARRRIQLTGKVPHVEIRRSESERLSTNSYLSAVVIRPDLDQVIEIWSARAKVLRPYWPSELEEMTWKIRWN